MELTISKEELQGLVESTKKSENRKFVDDSWNIAVIRIVFVRWMRAHKLWGGYVNRLSHNKDMKDNAWEHPTCAEDFLGRCNYEYSKAYIPWCDYISNTALEKTIYELINGYTKNSQVC